MKQIHITEHEDDFDVHVEGEHMQSFRSANGAFHYVKSAYQTGDRVFLAFTGQANQSEITARFEDARGVERVK